VILFPFLLTPGIITIDSIWLKNNCSKKLSLFVKPCAQYVNKKHKVFLKTGIGHVTEAEHRNDWHSSGFSGTSGKSSPFSGNSLGK
jgi:hypothetical protein